MKFHADNGAFMFNRHSFNRGDFLAGLGRSRIARSALGVSLAGAISCSGGDEGAGGPPLGSGGSNAGTANPTAGNAGSSVAGGGGVSGSSSVGAGASGASGANAVSGMGGSSGVAGAGVAGTGTVGVDPSKIVVSAIPANGTIGLEWPRVTGATSYRVYWSSMSGVTPQTGQAIDVPGPTFVHRGLTNGTDYYYVVTARTAAGEGPASNQATAKPAGEWVLEELGAGDIDDIVTGNRVPRIPIEKRVHVLLLPEGYLSTELGIFHDHAKHDLESPTNDVDRWIKEVFALDPYSKFREAFVIWYLPRASTTHTDGGNSAFGADSDTASAPLWAALDNAGPDAFLFPPTAASKNYVSAFLLFDPARQRAGVSGHTTSCRSPTDRALTMSCAFGIGHAHEFTHALSSVRDEYLEDTSSRTAVEDEWSNINGTNRCEELPWKHLLFGRGINTTDQLVGAFGRPERGYHSELQCQMNGTHDNGTYWCAAGTSLTLRPARFCNFCRELTTFRILYRTDVIQGTTAAAFASWKSMYRQPFFARFGFSVPNPVPQTVKCGSEPAKPVYEACVP